MSNNNTSVGTTLNCVSCIVWLGFRGTELLDMDAHLRVNATYAYCMPLVKKPLACPNMRLSHNRRCCNSQSWNMTINCSVELGAAGKRPARADSPHLDPKGKLYVLLQS